LLFFLVGSLPFLLFFFFFFFPVINEICINNVHSAYIIYIRRVQLVHITITKAAQRHNIYQ